MTIDVNTLIAIVDPEADEGDAIDSNGTLVINGGNIYAFAHPTSQDDGLDSDNGIYINGGTVIATGNMADSVSDNSKQDFIKLNFSSQQSVDTIVCITDKEDKPIMVFKSGRTFKTLTYSSSDLEKAIYHVYKGGSVIGTEINGLYTKIDSYTGGIQQQWISGGNQMGDMSSGDNNQGQMIPPDGSGQEGQVFSDGNERTELGENPPEKPDGDNKQEDLNNKNNFSGTAGQVSKDFTLTSQNHTFNNVSNYEGDINTVDDNIQKETESEKSSASSSDETTVKGVLPRTGASGIIIILLVLVVIGSGIFYKKYRMYNFK